MRGNALLMRQIARFLLPSLFKVLPLKHAPLLLWTRGFAPAAQGFTPTRVHFLVQDHLCTTSLKMPTSNLPVWSAAPRYIPTLLKGMAIW